MNSLRDLVIPILGLTATASAQAVDDARTTRIDEWMVPVHTAPADPVGGAYGIWAAGPTYKASFHDGFTFYPYLGPDRGPNVPFQWRTESVTVDGVAVVDLSARVEHLRTDWRSEAHVDGFTEAYDVLATGVEQTFVLRAPPARPGDLVITGRITTQLRADERAPRHGPIRFCDQDGVAVVEYGAAWAFDAVGRKVDVTTGLDGEHLRLIVPGAWLQEATYPVTVDPLTSRIWLYGAPAPSGGGEVLDSDVVLPVDYRYTDPRLTFVVHSREFASGDVDAYGQVADHNLGGRLTIWTDITASWQTLRPRCAHVGQEDLWVAAFERKFTAGNSGVRAYVHARSNGSPNVGTYTYLSAPGGMSYLRPDVSGSAGFNNSPSTCLVVYEQRTTGASEGRVFGALFDPVAGSFGAGFSLERSPASLVTQLSPSVITHAMGTRSFPWMVAWQERSSTDPNDDWDLFVNRIHMDGSRDQEAPMGPYADPGIDAYRPTVSGDWGRYLIAYSRGPRFVPAQVGYQRFDWSNTATQPTRLSERTLRRPLNGYGRVHAVAFDLNTQSHWTILYQNSTTNVSALRVGHTGGTTESASIHNFSTGVGAGGAAFSWRYEDFTLTYADNDLFFPLYGRRMTYPAAGTSTYGASCNASAGLVAFSDPYAGNGRFGLVFGFPPGLTTSAFLLASVSPDTWPIPGAGNCQLYLDAALMFVVDARAGVFHNEFFAIPLPDDPVFVGDFYFQGVYLRASANPLGLETTNGVQVRVR